MHRALWLVCTLLVLSFVRGAHAQAAAEDGAVVKKDTRLRIPFEPFRFEPFVLGAPPPGESDIEVTERIAHDAYMGGSGVAGPLALLGTTVNLVVEPALGVLAAFASEGSTHARTGTLSRSTAAAYGKTVSYMGTFIGLWVLSVPLWGVLVAGVPALTALGVAVATGFTPVGVAAAVAVGVTLAAVGGVALFSLMGMPWFLGRSVGTLVGDAVWNFMGDRVGSAEAQDGARRDLQELLAKKPVGPLPSIRGGVMLAAVTGGIWERNLKWDGIPLVGPFITSWRAHQAMPERLAEARRLVGEPPSSDHFRWQAPLLLYGRSVLLAGAQAGFITAAAMAAATGGSALVVALVPALGPTVALGVLAGGLGAAACVALGAFGLGVAATLANALLPWGMVLLSSADG